MNESSYVFRKYKPRFEARNCAGQGFSVANCNSVDGIVELQLLPMFVCLGYGNPGF